MGNPSLNDDAGKSIREYQPQVLPGIIPEVHPLTNEQLLNLQAMQRDESSLSVNLFNQRDNYQALSMQFSGDFPNGNSSLFYGMPLNVWGNQPQMLPGVLPRPQPRPDEQLLNPTVQWLDSPFCANSFSTQGENFLALPMQLPSCSDMASNIWEDAPQTAPVMILQGNPISSAPVMNGDLRNPSTIKIDDNPGSKGADEPRKKWTTEEDRMLLELVAECSTQKWTSIAKRLKTRTQWQCRSRWNNHLRPNIKKGRFSKEEDQILIDAHKELGNKWAAIARRLPSRTQASIKDHWNAIEQRVSTRRSRQCQHLLLEDYIESIHSKPTKKHRSPQYTSTSDPAKQTVGVDDVMFNGGESTMQEMATPAPLVGSDDLTFKTVDLPEFMFNEGGLAMQEMGTTSLESSFQLAEQEKI